MALINYPLRSAIALLLVGLLAIMAAPAPAGADGVPSTDVLCSSVWNPAYAVYMTAAMTRAKVASEGVTIGFFDRKTETTCFTDPSRQFQTASIVKVIVAVALQLRAQEEGRDLSDHERDLAGAMIIESNNNATSELWRQLHTESPYVSSAILVTNMTNTHPGPNGFFGTTTTTASDQINLLKFLTSPYEAALDLERRDYILELMSRVTLLHRYGVPVGAPFGTTWSNKIGYANLDDNVFDFTTHSIGAVRGTAWNSAQHDYVMALLSNQNFWFTGTLRVSRAAYEINRANDAFSG
ncbi:MAG TPA: serine hydrolase [Pseudonocardiaceae bacterium]